MVRRRWCLREAQRANGRACRRIGLAPCRRCPSPRAARAATSQLAPRTCLLLRLSRRYGSNIGVLMLNKYLLSIFGFRCAVGTGQASRLVQRAAPRLGGRSTRPACDARSAVTALSGGPQGGALGCLQAALLRLCPSILARHPLPLLPLSLARRYPVFLTLCHMLACSCMSYGVAASRLVTLQPVTSRRQFYKISLLALIFCLTVVLGNVSLKFIPGAVLRMGGRSTRWWPREGATQVGLGARRLPLQSPARPSTHPSPSRRPAAQSPSTRPSAPPPLPSPRCWRGW